MARVHVELYDRSRDQLFNLGRFNEGESTRLHILMRAYRKHRLDKMCECVPDYSMVIDGDRPIPLQVVRGMMIK